MISWVSNSRRGSGIIIEDYYYYDYYYLLLLISLKNCLVRIWRPRDDFEILTSYSSRSTVSANAASSALFKRRFLVSELRWYELFVLFFSIFVLFFLFLFFLSLSTLISDGDSNLLADVTDGVESDDVDSAADVADADADVVVADDDVVVADSDDRADDVDDDADDDVDDVADDVVLNFFSGMLTDDDNNVFEDMWAVDSKDDIDDDGDGNRIGEIWT